MKKTAEQEAVISNMAYGTGHTLVNAVAGSGKTTTILLGLTEVLIPYEQVALLAFNKKIQEELSSRAPKGCNVLTLNGLGHRAWTSHTGKRLRVNTKKVGSIVSNVLKELSTAAKTKEDKDYFHSLWGDIKNIVTKAKAIGILPSEFTSGRTIIPDTYEEWHAVAALHGYSFDKTIHKIARKCLAISVTEALKGEIDFDDQLYMPACFRANLPKYKLVIVDEAQDLSEIQHFLISRSIAPDGRLIAVGDPHQAIYGFRGALNDSLTKLQEKFQMTELPLSNTFRCAKEATAFAQRFVPHIQAAEGNKQGTISRLEYDWTPKDIQQGAVVLCRNTAPLVRLGLDCIKNGVSAYVVGRDIGAPLLKAVKQLNPLQDLTAAISNWASGEVSAAGGNLELLNQINDTAEALFSVTELGNIKTVLELESTLRMLFSKTTGAITLSTIHRAKGLEWEHVYILDSHRIPQKWIVRLIDKGMDTARWMLKQEDNLFYIAVTRTKDKLTFIDYAEKQMQDFISNGLPEEV